MSLVFLVANAFLRARSASGVAMAMGGGLGDGRRMSGPPNPHMLGASISDGRVEVTAANN